MVGDAVYLDEVDAPADVLGDEGVVPGLARGIVADAPVGRVPGACVGGVGDILSGKGTARDGKIPGDRLAGNASDDMDAELESLGVNVGRESAKAGVLSIFKRRRKACRNWDIASVRVELEAKLLRCFTILRIRKEPALVDDGVVVAKRLQLGGEDGDVVAELCLGDGETVRVPAIPAHGRTGRKGLRNQR